MKMKKTGRYRKLKHFLWKKEIDREELCSYIGRGKSYVGERLRGTKPWSQTDMYKIMDLLEIDYKNINLLFPIDGIDEEITISIDEEIYYA